MCRVTILQNSSHRLVLKRGLPFEFRTCNANSSQLQSTLDSLVHLLGLQLQVEAKRAADQTVTDISNILKVQSGQLNLLQNLQDASDAKEIATGEANRAEPVWIVPLSRNPKFVGREEVFEKLEKCLLKKDGSMAVAVLHGLGGVGCVPILLLNIILYHLI